MKLFTHITIPDRVIRDDMGYEARVEDTGGT